MISLHVSLDADLLRHRRRLLRWGVDMRMGAAAGGVDGGGRMADLRVDERGIWQGSAQ